MDYYRTVTMHYDAEGNKVGEEIKYEGVDYNEAKYNFDNYKGEDLYDRFDRIRCWVVPYEIYQKFDDDKEYREQYLNTHKYYEEVIDDSVRLGEKPIKTDVKQEIYQTYKYEKCFDTYFEEELDYHDDFIRALKYAHDHNFILEQESMWARNEWFEIADFTEGDEDFNSEYWESNEFAKLMRATGATKKQVYEKTLELGRVPTVEELNTVEALMEYSGMSRAGIYKIAAKLGRLPTREELDNRPKVGRPKKYN